MGMKNRYRAYIRLGYPSLAAACRKSFFLRAISYHENLFYILFPFFSSLERKVLHQKR